MVKVLVIDEWLPYPLDCGKKIRTFNLLKELASSFDITFACYGNSNESDVFAMERLGIKIECIEDRRLKKWTIPFYIRVGFNLFEPIPFSTIYHIRSEFKEFLTTLINITKPDVIHCEWTNLAPLLEGCDLMKAVIASHNIESDIWFRLAKQTPNFLKKLIALNQAKKIIELEKYWYPRVACCTAVSKIDNDIIESYGGRSSIVENGVDVDLYSMVAPRDMGNVIVFTASFDTFSNQDAAHFFVSEHWELIKRKVPNARLVFVGKCPTARMKRAAINDSSIHLTGRVPDVRPYIAEAKVCIVPLRIGGGSRLKIFEAMAMKKPVVSTTIGAEGIDVVDGRELILRDDPNDFAEAVVQCCFYEKKRQELTDNAYNFIKNRYDWRALAAVQKEVWLAVAANQA